MIITGGRYKPSDVQQRLRLGDTHDLDRLAAVRLDHVTDPAKLVGVSANDDLGRAFHRDKPIPQDGGAELSFQQGRLGRRVSDKDVDAFGDLGKLQRQHPVAVLKDLGTRMPLRVVPRTPRRSVDLQPGHVIALVAEEMDIVRPVDKLIALVDETVVIAGDNQDRNLASPVFAAKTPKIGLEPLDDILLLLDAAPLVHRREITCDNQQSLALRMAKGIVEFAM